jgi:acyl-ACP thioesterase
MIEWSTTYHLRANDFDSNDFILPSAILNFFQDIAGEHATKLGIGFETLKQNNLMWVIIRNKYTLFKNPKFYDDLTIKTWPLPMGKVEAQREYEIYDHGEKIGIGSLLWILCDYTTRKIVRMKDISYGEGELSCCHVYEDKLTKLQPLDEYQDVIICKTSYLQLDHNHHMNNTKYLDLIIENIPLLQGHLIKQVQIEYLKEIAKGEEVDLFYYQIDNKFFIKGISNDNLSFLAEISIFN